MNDILSSRSDFLFPSPSFLIGAGSIFNIGGNYFEYNLSETDLQADLRALISDWLAIKKDFELAEKKFKNKINTNQINLDFYGEQ
jgi:hypothetical protein